MEVQEFMEKFKVHVGQAIYVRIRLFGQAADELQAMTVVRVTKSELTVHDSESRNGLAVISRTNASHANGFFRYEVKGQCSVSIRELLVLDTDSQCLVPLKLASFIED